MPEIAGQAVGPDVDEKNLEITFSVASPTPFMREDDDAGEYQEVLVISEDAIDFSRLMGGAAILKNHDWDKTLGVVVRAWVEDEKLYIRARFRANDPESIAIFKDAAAGTLPNVSIGYSQEKIEFKDVDGVRVGYVVRWLPFECSVAVGVPADPTVGFYRSYNTKKGKMKMADENEEMTQEEYKSRLDAAEEELRFLRENAPGCGDDEERESGEDGAGEDGAGEDTGDDENDTEAEEIRAWGRRFNCRNAAEKAIKKGVTLKEFKSQVRGAQIATPARGFTVRDNQRYSVVNAIRALTDPDNPAYRFEVGVSGDLYRAMGKAQTKNAIMIDFRRAAVDDPGFRRTLLDGKTASGGALIGTDHRADLFIDVLRQKLAAKGVTMLSGLVENQHIPRQATTTTVTQKTNLTDDVDETSMTFDDIEMSPKKYGAWLPIGQDVLVQGNPSVLNLVLNDLLNASAKKLNVDIFAKVGTETGVGTVAMTIAAAKWADMLKFGAAIGDYEVTGTPTFVMNASNKQHFKGVTKDAGSGRFICEEDKIDGFDVEIAGHLGAGDLYFGDWSNVLLGQWGNGLEIMIDPYTLATSQKVRVIMNLLADIAIRNPALFVKRVDPAG